MISTGLGRKPVKTVRVDAAATNITTAAYLEIIAANDVSFSYLEVYNGTTKILKLAVGLAAAEVDVAHTIFPGIGSQVIPYDEVLKVGKRLTARAIDANATTGYLILNFYA